MHERWGLGVAGWLVLIGVVVACSDDGDDGRSNRSCGDGECSGTQCETPLRCPEDCGGCQGTQCSATGNMGSCGNACTSSCDCINPGEVCTADYGEPNGRCVPTDCLQCASFDRCDFVADGNGYCGSANCD